MITIAPNSSAILLVKSDEPSLHTIIVLVIFFNFKIIAAIFFSSLNAGMPITISKSNLDLCFQVYNVDAQHILYYLYFILIFLMIKDFIISICSIESIIKEVRIFDSNDSG